MRKVQAITYEHFRESVHQFTGSTNDSYTASYIEFLNYFEALQRIEKRHIIIGSHFTYGWMPRVLELNTQYIDDVVAVSNGVKNGKHANKEDIETVSKCINNSVVGASKLLHFINPSVYAIWDSKICAYMTDSKAQYTINNSKNYMDYLEQVYTLAAHPAYKNLHEKIARHFPYPITPLRAIEIVLFEANKAQSKI